MARRTLLVKVASVVGGAVAVLASCTLPAGARAAPPTVEAPPIPTVPAIPEDPPSTSEVPPSTAVRPPAVPPLPARGPGAGAPDGGGSPSAWLGPTALAALLATGLGLVARGRTAPGWRPGRRDGTGTPIAPSPGWQRQRRFLVVAVLADAILAAIIVALAASPPFRPLVVFVFLVLGPGLAVTGFLRFGDPGTELAVALPLSMALDTVIAGLMSLTGEWQPHTALMCSVAGTIAALGLQLRQWSATAPGLARAMAARRAASAGYATITRRQRPTM